MNNLDRISSNKEDFRDHLLAAAVDRKRAIKNQSGYGSNHSESGQNNGHKNDNSKRKTENLISGLVGNYDPADIPFMNELFELG